MHYLQFICNDETVFTFLTDLEAPRYHVVKINVSSPEKVSDFMLLK